MIRSNAGWDRSCVPRVDPRADLGVLGLVVAATEIHATPVEIVASPVVDAGAGDAIRGTGFLLDGTTLHVFPLWRNARGFARGDAPRPGWMDLDGGQQGGVDAYAIVSAGADAVAVLAVAPDTPVETVGRALARITGLRLPRYDGGMGGAAGIFRSVVLSPARATFEALRPPP